MSFFLEILQQAKAAAFQDAIGQAQQLLGKGRHVVGHLGAEFDVIDLFFEALVLDQLPVVGEIVVAGDGGLLVEALHQHALGIEVAEAVRPGDRFQVQLPRPLLHGLEQGGGHFGVVGGVEPAEAQVPGVVFFVGGAVINGGDASAKLVILVGQKQPRIGVLVSRDSSFY